MILLMYDYIIIYHHYIQYIIAIYYYIHNVDVSRYYLIYMLSINLQYKNNLKDLHINYYIHVLLPAIKNLLFINNLNKLILFTIYNLSHIYILYNSNKNKINYNDHITYTKILNVLLYLYNYSDTSFIIYTLCNLLSIKYIDCDYLIYVSMLSVLLPANLNKNIYVILNTYIYLKTLSNIYIPSYYTKNIIGLNKIYIISKFILLLSLFSLWDIDNRHYVYIIIIISASLLNNDIFDKLLLYNSKHINILVSAIYIYLLFSYIYLDYHQIKKIIKHIVVYGSVYNISINKILGYIGKSIIYNGIPINKNHTTKNYFGIVCSIFPILIINYYTNYIKYNDLLLIQISYSITCIVIYKYNIIQQYGYSVIIGDGGLNIENWYAISCYIVLSTKYLISL